MKKRIVAALFGLIAAISANAQTFHEDGYSYYFDYDHRVVIRSTVVCDTEAQDLWNGDYVRLNGCRSRSLRQICQDLTDLQSI